MKTASGQISVAKTAETGLGMTTEKKRKPSPLPIHIEIVSDNYEPEPETLAMPVKMSLGDLLCAHLPRKKKNWRLAIANQVREEAALIKHVNLGSSAVSRRMVNATCPSANLASADPALGKRQVAGSSRATLADVRRGIDFGLIKWQHLTFSGKVVDLLKKSAKYGKKDKDQSASIKFEHDTL